MSIRNILFNKRNAIDKVILKDNFSKSVEIPDIEIIEGDNNSSLGWGVAYKGNNFITHSKLPLSQSSLLTLSREQKSLFLALLTISLLGFVVNPKISIITFIAVLTCIYFADFIFSLIVLLKSLNSPPDIKFKKNELINLSDATLPVYSVLCPLYKEEKVLPQFLKAIDALNWPKDKLDVLLLLEEDDEVTIAAAGKIKIPSYVRVLVVPHSQPKTKPKACNYGLNFAKGEYVVVYDAEDKPDPMQLKKAYLAFNKLPSRVVCLQSKLNYYNTDQNLLTRLFTTEYSLWFDLILPGLQSVRSIIPLGGTSNHFKTDVLRKLQGWDAFNVTEDCDLGTRLFKMGYKTEIIDSTTFEEANSKFNSWLKQRSRWIKGYLQTYLVHMREPRDFFVKHGMHAFIFQLIIGMRMVFILINPILWLMTISYFILNPLVGSFIESLYPTPVFYIAVFCLVIANFMHFYNYMIGCAKRGYWDLVRYVFLIPFYWFSTSLASCIAFYQLAVKPHFWEKTEHGLHLAKHKPSFTEVKLSLDLETRSPHIVGNIISKILSPLVILFNNIMDFIDVLGPLPNLNGKDGLKIMIFNWRDTKHVWSGSAEVYVQELAKRWVASGHNVTIFCGWDGKTQREDNVDGVSIIRRGGFYTVYIFAFLYYIIRFKNKFDIVIDCENGIPFFSPLYANTPKLLLFHHVHQEVLSKHLRFPLSNIALFLESTLMPLLYQNTRIITVSESSKADIVERGWNNGQDVGVVNPGIFLNKETDYSKTPHPSFLYFGRLRAYKNVDVAIRAFARIISKHPEAKLTIAGTGETYFDLIKYTKSLGLGDSVIFTGRVSEEEKLKLLSQSWVALQPSSFEEWGITVLEANACGTPVIASDVKGLRDSVRDGQTGYLVEPKNADILSRAMEYLILNPLERNRLEKNSLFWSKYFSWDKSAWEFLTFINDELERKKRLIPSYETVRTEV